MPLLRITHRYFPVSSIRTQFGFSQGHVHDKSWRLMSTTHSLSQNSSNLEASEIENGIPNPDAPGWKESLASTSEAFVKADRSTPTSTTELQEKTVKFVTKRYTREEGTSSTTACYTKDEVSGPLGSAPGHEDRSEDHETVRKVSKKGTRVTIQEEG